MGGSSLPPQDDGDRLRREGVLHAHHDNDDDDGNERPTHLYFFLKKKII